MRNKSYYDFPENQKNKEKSEKSRKEKNKRMLNIPIFFIPIENSPVKIKKQEIPLKNSNNPKIKIWLQFKN